MQKLETEEQCRRLARAICSDISIYQKQHLQQAKSGLAVPRELEDAIEEGRGLFVSRAAPAFAHLYDTALSDILGIALNSAPSAPAAEASPVAAVPAPNLSEPGAVVSPVISAPVPNLPEPTAVTPPVVTASASNPPAPVAVEPIPGLSQRRSFDEEAGIFSKIAAIVILAVIIASAIYFFVLR